MPPRPAARASAGADSAALRAEIAALEARLAELRSHLDDGDPLVPVKTLAWELGHLDDSLRDHVRRKGIGQRIGGRVYARRSEVEHLRKPPR